MGRRVFPFFLFFWLSWALPAVAGPTVPWGALPPDSLLTIVYTGESWGEYAPCPT